MADVRAKRHRGRPPHRDGCVPKVVRLRVPGWLIAAVIEESERTGAPVGHVYSRLVRSGLAAEQHVQFAHD